MSPIEATLPESSPMQYSPSRPEDERSRRFTDLRGVQWRIDLGILPSSSPSTFSIDDVRRVTADSRRRYVALRRRLLIDPLIVKDGSNSPDHVMDNPLSQNPDSMWGRFFRNAELERILNKDLSRLYPEHGSYFQTPECQGMLRRILLLWCLKHPDYGYRQGMHELLAPLLYVLHVDVEHLSKVQKIYEDHFTDKFDGFSFHENDLTYKFDFKKFSGSLVDEIRPQNSLARVSSFSELDPRVKDIVLLSDAYGAEGELGIVLSEKFMEHDAYCMFDALMNGVGGAVAMVEFFSHSPLVGSHTGIPPVIEASSALYHLLSVVDSSLHSHLVELGVEPQYFALRWLRVLFGREFALEDLLIVWDEIFASDNKLHEFAENDVGSSFGVLNSSRGAFISALAVSMILHLRSSLLATENATSCLQRLLNFPDDINVEKLIAKAKSFQGLALDACNSTSPPMYTGAYNPSKSVIMQVHSLSSDSVSPITALSFVPESYWEEKWRVLHKEEESKEGSFEKRVPNRIKGWSEKVKLRLSRTESDTSISKVDSGKRDRRSSVRRSLLKDLARQLGSEEDAENVVCGEEVHRKDAVEEHEQDVNIKNFSSISDDRCLNGNVGSEEESSIFSDPPSPIGGANDHENESDSSVASNLSVVENDLEQNNANCSKSDPEALPLLISDSPDEVCLKSEQNVDSTGKPSTNSKERKLVPGKFQWFWKFGRNAGGGTYEKGGSSEATKASTSGCIQHNEIGSSTTDSFDTSSVISKGDAMDQNVMVTFRNLGQSMLENIQVIESAFQLDWGQAGTSENYSKNGLVGRGQVTSVAALKELRKISNILSEMRCEVKPLFTKPVNTFCNYNSRVLQ